MKKPDLKIVELYEDIKPQIQSLSDRLYETIIEYIDQQISSGNIVTVAEIIGTLELLKDRIKEE
jgi:hypothetical protein